ncbi:MAG: four helix bundle protein [Anaerolineales bacterium]|nr:four helix bundle protein [Anaerolineales bacterium]
MPLIKKFEDIRAWQEARILNKSIYSLTQNEPFAKDWGLRQQIQRASVSIMTNIAEGFDCESRKEFARFLTIARRSAVEVQSLLYTALDVGYISQDSFEMHYAQARKTISLIGALRHSLRQRPERAPQEHKNINT